MQIMVSGLTLGAMYAIGTVSLSLLWGAVNVLNMAHGALLIVGAYGSWFAVARVGMPAMLGYVAGGLVAGGVTVLLYLGILRWVRGRATSEVLNVVATFAIAIILENLVLNIFGGYALPQPAKLGGGVYVSSIYLPAQNILIMSAAIGLVVLLEVLLQYTPLGRSIRAVAQNPDAAVLMGIRIEPTYISVFAIAGIFAGISGVFWSSISNLSPTMGFDPMLKSFIICVAAGLGNVRGSLVVAVGLGVAEAAIQYFIGVRFALPLLLLAVAMLLIARPQGLFGQAQRARQ